MQCEEAVQCGIGNVEVAANPSGQVGADHGNRTEQVNNHLCAPERHLTPRQQVAHEGFRHQGQENQRAEYPHQFARFFVRAVNQAAEHVQIYYDKEERCTGGVHVADNPAAGYVTHDVFDCGKGNRQVLRVGCAVGLEVHRQENTAHDLDDKYQQSQRAEEIPEVEIFRCVVLPNVFVVHFGQGETSVHPAQQCFEFAVFLVFHSAPLN